MCSELVMGEIPSFLFLIGITIMNEEEKEIIARFEKNARPVDRAAYIMAKEQIAVMEEMRKEIGKVRKEIVQLRADVKQESAKRMDDGK